MARRRKDDTSIVRMGRVLTSPTVYLARMAVTLILIGFLAAILGPQLATAFKTNPFLNGVIVLVFAIGCFYAFWQVMRLYPEIRWVNAFRIADPGLVSERQPVLLAPMSTMLRERTGTLSLSTASMRSIMDSIGSRLDEARDTGRYVVGLLVFLGLLGTFWGLLDTMQAVGQTIASLDTKGGDGAAAFSELKEGLAAPLRGMGTAFSSSLLGLAGSLVLGFLELQASQSHNRFYNELEEWLSGITELSPGASGGSDQQLGRQIYTAVFEMQRAMSELSDRLATIAPQGMNGAGADPAVKELATGVNQLVSQMRNEQNIVRQWVDEQAAQQAEVATMLKDLASTIPNKPQRRS
jgi:hypothetical protein